jgi:Conserved mid region of cactin/Cactus-binding C-terminus of cactin protein
MRINQLQEDERMREWVSQEDDFVLRQAKKKAEIRIKEGRPKPIDWLAVTLRMVDETRDPLDDDINEADLDFVDPDSVFDGLSESQLSELRKDIDTYEKLEKNRTNREYWRTMQIICKDRQRKLRALGPEGRAVSSVASDIDKLLGPKTYEELERLEGQIRSKLDSNEPIDTDYWQQLLDSLLIWKAKAKLKRVYQSVLDARLGKLRQESEHEARQARQSLVEHAQHNGVIRMSYSKELDPDPSLHVSAKDKALEMVDENTFLSQIAADRRKVLRMGYVPLPKGASKPLPGHQPGRPEESSTTDLFSKDVARGVDEDEEVFASEELSAQPPPVWSGKYRPRKPKYFNRVQMGYEWNKYNQTHYDHDNPPPKVVQGYKFHVFYPELIDITKAPTYKIIREGGRKKGQTMAPAGEEDTCIIRFTSGPPYEDVAFRIVDRDWDYSAKADRGFKSTFEKGVLSLHFSFKKVYYRK